MNRESRILCVFTFTLAMILMQGWYSFAATSAPKKPAAATAAKPTTAASVPKAPGSSKTTCLACHGPYEKIIAKTADYMMQSGDKDIKSNPHRYVPHDSKDIPECSYCHEPHPVPLSTKEALPKPKATWCYGCHHSKVLTCGTCH